MIFTLASTLAPITTPPGIQVGMPVLQVKQQLVGLVELPALVLEQRRCEVQIDLACRSWLIAYSMIALGSAACRNARTTSPAPARSVRTTHVARRIGTGHRVTECKTTTQTRQICLQLVPVHLTDRNVRDVHRDGKAVIAPAWLLAMMTPLAPALSALPALTSKVQVPRSIMHNVTSHGSRIGERIATFGGDDTGCQWRTDGLHDRTGEVGRSGRGSRTQTPS